MRIAKIYPLEKLSDKDLKKWARLSKSIKKLEKDAWRYNWQEYFNNAKLSNDKKASCKAICYNEKNNEGL